MAKVNRYDVKRNISKKDILFGSDSERNLASTNFEVGDFVDVVKKDIEVIVPKRTSDLLNNGEEGTDRFIEEQELPNSLLLKHSYNWVEENLQGLELEVSTNKRSIVIVGDNTNSNGVINGLFGVQLQDDFPDGVELSIQNNRLQPITIINGSLASKTPFSLYIDKNYLLKHREVISFRYVKKDNVFVSVGVLGVSESDIGEIIGEEKYKLFIDSSQGDAIDANTMQTTLTAYVDKYFADVTSQVTQWQWFRESGKTQEDIDSDEIWSMGKNNRVLYLNAVDFTKNIYENPITFTCQATIDNQNFKAKATIS